MRAVQRAACDGPRAQFGRHATCTVQRAACNAQRALSNVRRTACNVQRAACNSIPASSPGRRDRSPPGMRLHLLETFCRPPPRYEPRRGDTNDNVQRVMCSVRRKTCHVQRATCTVQYATCSVQRATRNVRLATCGVRRATCDRQRATCDVRQSTCSVQRAARGVQQTLPFPYQIRGGEIALPPGQSVLPWILPVARRCGIGRSGETHNM